jgi:ABC-type uncharacterized transport system permease subunit
MLWLFYLLAAIMGFKVSLHVSKERNISSLSQDRPPDCPPLKLSHQTDYSILAVWFCIILCKIILPNKMLVS